jgi:hypothetical protein
VPWPHHLTTIKVKDVIKGLENGKGGEALLQVIDHFARVVRHRARPSDFSPTDGFVFYAAVTDLRTISFVRLTAPDRKPFIRISRPYELVTRLSSEILPSEGFVLLRRLMAALSQAMAAKAEARTPPACPPVDEPSVPAFQVFYPQCCSTGKPENTRVVWSGLLSTCSNTLTRNNGSLSRGGQTEYAMAGRRGPARVLK